MGKRHRNKGRRVSSPLVEAELIPMQPAAYYGSGYQGAWNSKERGYVEWHTIDTRQELDSFSRFELIRRLHFLYGNFGFLRGVIRSTARLVGSVSPQAQTDDEAWQTEAEAYFWDVCGEAAAFDVACKFDFRKAQSMLIRRSLLDGQIFTVLTKWEDGNARFAFYEASQLSNPKDAGENWIDGIQIDKRTRRHIAYGFRDGATENVVVIPARSVIYFGEFDSPGEDMPVPPLSHAVNHALDITEVWGFVKSAIKNASLSGTVIERDAQAGPPRARQGLAGVPTTTVNAAGQKFTSEQVMGGAQIPRMEPGEKMKVLEDRRPSPEQRQLILDLKRDICQGVDMPIEIFDDMGNLTGPGVRYVMDFAGKVVTDRRDDLKTWSRRVWRYVIACGIANGRLREPQKTASQPRAAWWDVSCTVQRLLTIDRGKESKARLDELDRGVGTLAQFEEYDGLDWKDRGKQRIKEVTWLTAECEAAGTTYEKVFPPRQGAATAAAPEKEDVGKTENDTTEEET
jgi:capsid protein